MISKSIFFVSTLLLSVPLVLQATYADHPAHTDSHLELLIPHAAIQERIQAVSELLNTDYAGKEVVLIMVMKGSVCLVADLMRHIHVPCTLECVQASSYGMHGTKAGALTVTGVDALDLTNKHVLLVDDIFDTGNTLKTIASRIQEKKPATLKTLVLLCKKVQRAMSFVPDYVLFELDNLFVVGYGLDYKGHYRGLPGIYVLLSEPVWLCQTHAS